MAEWIPITRPVLAEAEEQAVTDVLRSGFLVQGPRVVEFEQAVGEVAGRAFAVALSNCTSALRVALLALGVGRGDLVVVAPYSWVATANVVELCGATPVFVDVDPVSFNMSAGALDACLADLDARSRLEHVKAVLPVDTFGNPAGIDDVCSVASRVGVPVVEDAACALGATIGERAAGSFGTVGCFSFHPRKIVTTGEGGVLVTDDSDIATYARAMRNHGQSATPSGVEFVMAGDNLRLTEIQGAIGVEQMRRLPSLLTRRRQLAESYDHAVRTLGCVTQARAPGAAVQSYVVLLPDEADVTEVIAKMRANEVEVTIGTNVIPFVRHYQQRYQLTPTDLPIAARISQRALTLPLFPTMTSAQQDRVLDVLAHALQ